MASSSLPPFKMEFEDQQKPTEIHVLNDLVKYNNCLNASLICNLSFQVTLPRGNPPLYSIPVNRIPRQRNINTIPLLLAEQYSSTDHVTRIFHDGQPTA